MDRDTAGPCLPTPHCKIDIERIQLDQPGATTDLLGSDQGSPRAGEGIEHNVAALGGVEQRIGHQAHGLWRRVLGQDIRSEEHTSELQSLMRISYAVFSLKKKDNKNNLYQQT